MRWNCLNLNIWYAIYPSKNNKRIINKKNQLINSGIYRKAGIYIGWIQKEKHNWFYKKIQGTSRDGSKYKQKLRIDGW